MERQRWTRAEEGSLCAFDNETQQRKRGAPGEKRLKNGRKTAGQKEPMTHQVTTMTALLEDKKLLDCGWLPC